MTETANLLLAEEARRGARRRRSRPRLLSRLPKNCVVGKNPAGTYSFTGSCDVRLCYFRRDGQPITDEDARKIASFGAGIYRATIGVRTWPTLDEAVQAARELGLEVTFPGGAK